MSKLIDIKRKGQAVRFYIGDDDLKEWWGDDWNDYPFECNAGTVYDEFIKRTLDVCFPFDTLVIEPTSSGYRSIEYSKDEMVKRKVPCLMIDPDAENHEYVFLSEFIGNDNVIKIYFGDSISKITKIIEKMNGVVLKNGGEK